MKLKSISHTNNTADLKISRSLISFILFFAFFFVFFFITSCTSKSGPDSVLKSFIDQRFSSSVNIDDLVAISTGALKERLESMEEQDKSAYLKKGKIKLRKYKVNFMTCTKDGTECNVNYDLSFNEVTSQKKSFTTFIKKIATLKKESGTWKVADIEEVKTYIQNHQSIDP